MTKDFFRVDIPVFVPIYETDKLYGWSKYKDNLWDLLKQTTGGYCMYCYDSVWINEQRRGQIEHGIERANSEEYLSDCIPNLGLACENCNGSYKRRGEAGRKLSIESIKEFETGECKKFACKEPCEKYKKIRREYIKNGKFILQPFEAKICEDGHSLRLQYDLLRGKYIPSQNHGKYSDEELKIINEHIRLLGLNTPERKNCEIAKYCKNVIASKNILLGFEYNNLVVDLFREKLRLLAIEEAVKICKVIYQKAFYQKAT